MFYCTQFTLSGWQHPFCGYYEKNIQEGSMQSYFGNCSFQLTCCTLLFIQIYYERSMIHISIWIALNCSQWLYWFNWSLLWDCIYISYSACIFVIVMLSMRIFHGILYGCTFKCINLRLYINQQLAVHQVMNCFTANSNKYTFSHSLACCIRCKI